LIKNIRRGGKLFFTGKQDKKEIIADTTSKADPE
jgi:hypothetical protein